jgi:hypothetical protein
MPSEVETKAQDWEQWTATIRTTHYRRADSLRQWNNRIGVAAVSLTTVVSAGILTSIHNEKPSFGWKIAAALVGLAASALTALNSYLNLGALSEKHRHAASNFGKVRRKLELFVLRHPPDDDDSRGELDEVAAEIAKYETDGPGFPKSVFDAAQKRVHEQYAAARDSGSNGRTPPEADDGRTRASRV